MSDLLLFRPTVGTEARSFDKTRCFCEENKDSIAEKEYTALVNGVCDDPEREGEDVEIVGFEKCRAVGGWAYDGEDG